MSDSALNYYIASGTSAARLAFIPNPPPALSGPNYMYLWYETDTGNTYAFVSGAWQPFASSSGTVTSVNASGGTTGLTFSGGPIISSGTLTLGGTLAIANGGTGSATQNFVDLTNNQATIAGIKTFTTQLIGKGTATNDNAASGYIGEYITSTVLSGSSVAISNNTSTTVTSISLPPGDYDITGAVWHSVQASSMASAFRAWASLTAVTVPTPPANGYNYNFQSVSGPNDVPISVNPFRISIASTSTLFLTGFVTIASGTCRVYGFVSARRAR